MNKTEIDHVDHSWFDVGSRYIGKAINRPLVDYYAMLISEGLKNKFELRIKRSAAENIQGDDPPYSIYKWLWYMSLVIALEMEDTIPFLIMTITAGDVIDGKLITPWRNLDNTSD